jgi:alkylation response protein AidB-like acyl-CoA dehydrogenase
MTAVTDDVAQEDMALAEFRAKVRAFMEANAVRRPAADDPAPPKHGPWTDRELVAAGRAYQGALFDAGLAALTWPTQYGGQGLPGAYQTVFNDEISDYFTPDSIYTIGFGMCIPTVLAHGSEANKARYVRPAARGEEIWCQLFSEPSAGSDVASLRSRAVRDGDEWILNGQKIWTSGAQYCQFGIVLARTDVDAPKHRGLSMFILDMASPGVTVKPLRQMNGASGFNEVFFDDVRIPADRILGSPGDGWRVALTTLMNERVAIGTGRSSEKAPPLAPIAVHLELAQQRGLIGDPLVRQDLVDLFIRYKVLEMLGLRIRGTLAAGRVPGPEGSVAKLSGAILSRRSADVAARLAGPSATAWSEADAAGAAQMVLTAPAGGIAGGTNEVMRNILGERVLGLPKEPSVDKDLPFKDLPFS